MSIELSIIIESVKDGILSVNGDPSKITIQYLKAPEEVDESTLDWISTSRSDKQRIAELSRARVIISDISVRYSEILAQQEKVLIHVKDPKWVITKIAKLFFIKKIDAKIHETAIIHPEAQIGENVFIGPNTIIGLCRIGKDSVIQGNVGIHDHVIIGNHVIINSGAVLGADGFGIEQDEHGKYYRFPQLGKLIIEDHVEIGSNTCIDKGSLKDTIIGENTRISNLCQIAHNVKIGKNVVIAGQSMLSGSCVIQDNVWLSPNVVIRDHIQIGEYAFIGMGSVVTKNVPSGETWLGNPAKKI